MYLKTLLWQQLWSWTRPQRADLRCTCHLGVCLAECLVSQAKLPLLEGGFLGSFTDVFISANYPFSFDRNFLIMSFLTLFCFWTSFYDLLHFCPPLHLAFMLKTVLTVVTIHSNGLCLLLIKKKTLCFSKICGSVWKSLLSKRQNFHLKGSIIFCFVSLITYLVYLLIARVFFSLQEV